MARRHRLSVAVGIVLAIATLIRFCQDPTPPADTDSPEIETAASDPEPDIPAAGEPPADLDAAHQVAAAFAFRYLDRASGQSHADWHASLGPYVTDRLDGQLAISREPDHPDDGWDHDPTIVGVQTTTSRQYRVEVIVLAELDDGRRTVPVRLGLALVDRHGSWAVDDIQ